MPKDKDSRQAKKDKKKTKDLLTALTAYSLYLNNDVEAEEKADEVDNIAKMMKKADATTNYTEEKPVFILSDVAKYRKYIMTLSKSQQENGRFNFLAGQTYKDYRKEIERKRVEKKDIIDNPSDSESEEDAKSDADNIVMEKVEESSEDEGDGEETDEEMEEQPVGGVYLSYYKNHTFCKTINDNCCQALVQLPGKVIRQCFKKKKEGSTRGFCSTHECHIKVGGPNFNIALLEALILKYKDRVETKELCTTDRLLNKPVKTEEQFMNAICETAKEIAAEFDPGDDSSVVLSLKSGLESYKKNVLYLVNTSVGEIMREVSMKNAKSMEAVIASALGDMDLLDCEKEKEKKSK
jgi:hypothetical protein